MHFRDHRVVVVADPGHLVSAADVHGEFAGAFFEQPFKPLLRERQSVHRRICQLGEVQMHAAEREPRSRHGAGAGRFEAFQQAPVAQQLQDLPAQTTGLRAVPALRLPLQHQRSYTGQTQFPGQHQAGWAGTHNNHIGVRHWPLLSQVFGWLPYVDTARTVPTRDLTK
jgi:hypothetical protein